MECSHEKRHEIKGPFGPHHGKFECSSCAKFLGWIPAPRPERQQSPTVAKPDDSTAIITLLRKGELSDWERDFLDSLERQRNWTERQGKAFDTIRVKYLKVAQKPADIMHASDDDLAGIF